MSSNKLDKIIARLQAKTAEGQYYEAQQQTRVVAARYIKQRDHAAAIAILEHVARSLLQAGRSGGGSGGDLALLLVDVYKQAQLRPDAASKGRLLALLRLFPPEEPTRKKFIAEMIAWSATFGPYPAGEPDLHHVAGTLCAEAGDAYEAERHLVLGTRDSPDVLARMEYEWYTQDETHTAATYAARAVLPYLVIGNVRDAARALAVFTSALTASASAERVASASATGPDPASSPAPLEALIFPSLPLLNFLALLVVAAQKGHADLFRQLQNRYAAHLRDVETLWAEALVLIGESYFGIARPRQGNPLFDMMGSMFGGGLGGGGAGGGKAPPRRIGASMPPPAEGLD